VDDSDEGKTFTQSLESLYSCFNPTCYHSKQYDKSTSSRKRNTIGVKMKKLIVILGIVLVAAFATAGLVYAQTGDPQDPTQTPGFGWMQGMHSRMMGGGYAGTGLMHTDLVQAFSDETGISVEDINAQLAGGSTLWLIAEGKGWTTDQFTTWLTETRAAIFQQLVDDGTLTQEQADWMNSRMSQRTQNGYGLGTCNGLNTSGTTFQGGGMMRGRNGGFVNRSD
jgi:hypothetical protein